jgi:hypothetical protein
MTKRLGQDRQNRLSERDIQNRTDRTGQTEQDRQNWTDKTGQSEQEMQNKKVRKGKAEQKRQNKTGRILGRQNWTGRT